jgi:hypothetical protein
MARAGPRPASPAMGNGRRFHSYRPNSLPRFGLGRCDCRHKFSFEYPIIFWTPREAPCYARRETRLGRPPIAPALEKRIREALATPGRPGVRVIAKQFGVNPGSVQRISRPFEQDAVATWSMPSRSKTDPPGRGNPGGSR